MQIKCIDVSCWQTNIDYQKVKASGIQAVIIRAGYGREVSQKDSQFEEHYKNAKSAGLKIGAYWYSCANSVNDAKKEAQACLVCVKNKTFDLPIYFDIEDKSQNQYSGEILTDMCTAFCDTIQNNGYRAGVYTFLNWFETKLDYVKLKNKYSIWIAAWGAESPKKECDIWQYTDTGSVNGVKGDVDMNIINNNSIINNTSNTDNIKLKENTDSQLNSAKIVDYSVKVTSDNGVNIRSGAGTNYTVKDAVPYNAILKITRQTNGSGYTWGYTNYNGVTGWITLDFTKKVTEIKVGSTVKVKQDATTYMSNIKLSDWVYSTKFTVMELSNDRAVIGINGQVTAAVNKNDLTSINQI